MSIPLKEYNRLQIQEMERHKWIESEKAGKDLGESCLIEWIKRYGHQFRQHFFQDRSSSN